jgi:riboflavin kinase/FMN adenylyltransferase
MEVVRDIAHVPERLRHAVVALGNFDGVHLGHRQVIQTARSQAASAGTHSGVISFHPHPRRHFSPDKTFFRLTPQPLKLRLLAALGVDVTFIVPFDARLAALSPGAFAAEILVGCLRVGHVVAGWDFRFGARRAGDAAILEELGSELGFGVTIVTPHRDEGGEAFSSTRIRKLLAAGDPRAAARALGYRWRLAATVIAGEGRGHDLGFPTINMALDPGVELARGIYAVRAHVDGEVLGGAAYFGTRPTFGGRQVFLETFLFDFDGDLYGRAVEIEFVDYLRGDEAFSGDDELKAQIARDCEHARSIIDGLDDEGLIAIASTMPPVAVEEAGGNASG